MTDAEKDPNMVPCPEYVEMLEAKVCRLAAENERLREKVRALEETNDRERRNYHEECRRLNDGWAEQHRSTKAENEQLRDSVVHLNQELDTKREEGERLRADLKYMVVKALKGEKP